MQGASRESSGLNQKSANYSLNRGDGTGDREGKNISLEVVRRQHKGPEPSHSGREGRHPQSNMDKVRAAGGEEGRRIDLLSKRKATNRDDGEYVEPKSLPQKWRKIESSAGHNAPLFSLSRDEKQSDRLHTSQT